MQLTVTPYHQHIVHYFKQQTKTWEFFSKETNKEKHAQNLQTELLKNTYKFEEADNETLYNHVKIAQEKLGLQFTVTIYQAQYSDELNASIVYVNNHAHIIFSGQIIKLLSNEELLAVLAHELSHIKLYNMLGGDVGIADTIVTAIGNQSFDDASYYETAKLFKLYTEIFCDRGAYTVTQKVEPIISSLVKIATGLDNINVESYLKQADEVFSTEKNTKTEQVTHPENFIRARAINLWHNKVINCEDIISEMIQGNATLDSLDLLQQQQLTQITKQIISLFLKPEWIKSSLVLTLARQYFPQFSTNHDFKLDKNLVETIEPKHSSIKEYIAYILFDFALADASLEEVPLGWAFQFAEDLGIKEQFRNTVKKELQLTEKKCVSKQQEALDAFYKVKENDAEQIYE